MVKIKQNTTVVDVSFNLSGSLTGLPAIVKQLPVGERVGFDNLPEMWQDVQDIGQTWTPDLQGLTLDLAVPVYDTLGQAKAPYSTDLYSLQKAITDGEKYLRLLLDNSIRACDVTPGMNLRGATLYLDAVPGQNYTFLQESMWLRTVQGWNVINQQHIATESQAFTIVSSATQKGDPTYVLLYNGSQGIYWPVTVVNMQDDKDLIVGENTLKAEKYSDSEYSWSWANAYFKLPKQ